MSDFLSKFNKDRYAETLDNKDQVDTASPSKKSGGSKRSPHIQRVEHVENFEVDPSYRRRQQRKWLIAAIVVILLSASSFGLYFVLNQVRVPDFVNQPISELRTWANRNNMTLSINEEFSLDINAGLILAIDPLPNTTLQKGSILNVQVSKGADPDERIQVPNFEGFVVSQIQEWLEINQVRNLRLTFENSDVIDPNQFIRLSFNDTSITAETFRRKDYGVITISRGPVVYEKNIAVPDWISTLKTLSDAQTWATTNDVQLVIQRESSSRIGLDGIIRQAPTAGTLVAKKDKVTIVVSLGERVLVPDFRTLSMEAAEALRLPNTELRVVRMYNNTNAFGSYIWQDRTAGNLIDQVGQPLNLTVYYSLGRPFIDRKIGWIESLLPEYFYELNQSGAELTYTISYVTSCSSEPSLTRGRICTMSVYDQFVNTGTNIHFTLVNEVLAP